MKKLLLATAVAVAVGFAAPTSYAAEPTIPIIVKDTTSNYWQIVLAGARKAGKDLASTCPSSARNPIRHQRPNFDPRRTPYPKNPPRS